MRVCIEHDVKKVIQTAWCNVLGWPQVLWIIDELTHSFHRHSLRSNETCKKSKSKLDILLKTAAPFRNGTHSVLPQPLKHKLTRNQLRCKIRTKRSHTVRQILTFTGTLWPISAPQLIRGVDRTSMRSAGIADSGSGNPVFSTMNWINSKYLRKGIEKLVGDIGGAAPLLCAVSVNACIQSPSDVTTAVSASCGSCIASAVYQMLKLQNCQLKTRLGGDISAAEALKTGC